MKAFSAIISLILTWIGFIVYNNLEVFSSSPQFVLFPQWELSEKPESQKDYTTTKNYSKSDEYIIEKFTHEQIDGEDVRNGVFLTYHKYFFNEISTKTIQVQEREFSLNDICFKPHRNFFHDWKTGKKPKYVERLELEAKRLSPCLIVTPLNCFYDSYRLHSDISLWKYDVNQLNRRLRDSYTESANKNDPKPYVKADDGLTLIEKWSELMWTLSQKSGHQAEKVPKEWIESVRKWVVNMKPTSKACANPIRSCDNFHNDDLNYSEMCNSMDKNTDWTDGTLDCLDDREKFADWAQKRELESIRDAVSAMSSNGSILHKTISGTCSGVFQVDIDFFDTNRHFSHDSAGTNSNEADSIMKFELVLLKPEQVLSQLNEKARINGVVSIFTIEDAEEIVDELRSMFRDEAIKFNDRMSSKKFGIRTTVLKDPKVDIAEPASDIYWMLFAILLFFFIMMGLSCFLLWENNRVYSSIMFSTRVISGVLVFANVFSIGGIVSLRMVFLFHFIVLIILNVVLSTIISKMKIINYTAHRRQKSRVPTGNLSSLSSVSNVSHISKWSVQTVIESLDRIMRKEKMRKPDIETTTTTRWRLHRYHFSWMLFFAYFSIVWFFDDGTHLEIFVLMMSSLSIFIVEWFYADWELEKYREYVDKRRKELLKSVSSSREILAASIEETDGSRKRSIEDIEKASHLIETLNSARSQSHRQSFDNVYNYRRNENIFDRVARSIKFHSLKAVFRVVIMKNIVPIVVAILGGIILMSIAVICLPIPQNVPGYHLTQTGEDIFVDVQFNNFSKYAKDRLSKMDELTDHLGTVENLHLVSNWKKDIWNFIETNCTSLSMKSSCEKISNWNNSTSIEIGRSFASVYPKWFRADPIVSSIVTINGRPTETQIQLENFTPNRFAFRIRYELVKSSDSNDRKSIEKIGEIAETFNSDPEHCVVTVYGNSYSFYQEYYRVWNKYLLFELITSVVLILLSLIFVKMTIPTYNSKLLLMFSIIALAVKLEISAFVWILSGVLTLHHLLFTNTAFVSAFVVFGRLFIAVNKFEVEKKNMNFDEKLKASRPIFSAFLDVVLLLIVLITGALFMLSVSFFFPPDGLFSHFLVAFFILCALFEFLLIIMLLSRLVIGNEIIAVIERNSKELTNRTDLIKKIYFAKGRPASAGSAVSINSKSKSESYSLQVIDEEEEEEVVSLEESDTSSLCETSSVSDECSGEEDYDSRGECDEEVLGVVMSMHARWQALKDIPSTSTQPPLWNDTSSVHSKSSDGKKENGSDEKGVGLEGESHNQPSTSNPQPQSDHQEVEEVVDDGRHRYADYFPTDFTNEMIDFMIDPDNRGGQPWIVPAEKPTKEFLAEHQRKVDAAIQIVLAVTPSVSDEEDSLSITSSSSDEGIGDVD